MTLKSICFEIWYNRSVWPPNSVLASMSGEERNQYLTRYIESGMQTNSWRPTDDMKCIATGIRAPEEDIVPHLFADFNNEDHTTPMRSMSVGDAIVLRHYDEESKIIGVWIVGANWYDAVDNWPHEAFGHYPSFNVEDV